MKTIQQLFWILISLLLFGCDTLSNAVSDNTNSTQSELPAPPVTTKTIQVACVGDSITQGVGISNVSDRYPAQLSKLLGEGWKVKNFGVKSATLMNAGNLPYGQTKKFHASRGYNPDIVVIMLGTNDAKHHNWAKQHHFISDYTKLIKSYENLPSQPIVYICYPPTVKKSVAGISNQRIKHEVIPKIKQVSLDNSVSVIDVHAAFYQKKGLFADDVHPNKHGAKEVANIVYSTIY